MIFTFRHGIKHDTNLFEKINNHRVMLGELYIYTNTFTYTDIYACVCRMYVCLCVYIIKYAPQEFHHTIYAFSTVYSNLNNETWPVFRGFSTAFK